MQSSGPILDGGGNLHFSRLDVKQLLKRNRQAEISVPFVEHQPFVHHHTEEGLNLFFTEPRKLGKDLGNGPLDLAKKVNHPGIICQTMCHIIFMQAAFMDNKEILPIFIRKNRPKPRSLVYMLIEIAPFPQFLPDGFPHSLLMPDFSMIPLDHKPETLNLL